MTTFRALIVEDNPEIVEIVEDILRSLGHEFDAAFCQAEARELLGQKQHDYYLLDLEIPVETGRGLPRIQNGENLLREIISRRAGRHAPVIIMTSHGTDTPRLAVRMMKLGASDYVTKPFDTVGKTLDNAILEALRPRAQPQDRASQGAQVIPADGSGRFAGGEMVFYPNRIELCGVIVVRGQCLMRRVLEILRRRQSNGKYVAMGGSELAERLGVLRGQNAISEAVKDFRDYVGRSIRQAWDQVRPAGRGPQRRGRISAVGGDRGGRF